MTASRFSLIDYVVLLISLAAVLAIGWRLRGGVRGVGGYLFGDRSLPSWVAGLGLLAANVGIQEVIGMGAAGAKYGFAAAHFFWLGAIPAMVFLGLFMMPVYRGAGARSVPEYLGLRFDAKTRTLSAVAFATMMVFASGVVLYVLGSAAHVLLDWQFGAAVALAAGVSLLYVLWGGLTGTIYAGVLQFVLLVFGLAPLLLIGFAATDGWPMLQHRLTQAAINSQLPQGFYTHLWKGMGHPLTNAFGVTHAALLMGLGGALAFGYWCTDVRVVQRAMTARSTTAARRAPLIAAIPMLLLPALLAIPGMLALMLGGGEAGKPYGGMAQGLIPATRAADGTALLDAGGRTLLDFGIATPKLLATLYPSGMLGLGVAALLAACLAAMAANLTAFNTVITWDLYRARVRRDASDASDASGAHDLRLARVATLVGALLAIAAAYGVQAFGNLLDVLQLMVAFVNVPLFAALALGMFWKRITGHGAFAGVATGMLAAFVHHGLSLSRGARPGVDGGFLAIVLPYYTPLAQALWTAIVAFTASAVVTIVVSLCTRPRPAAELHGLVYSRASLNSDAGLAWWKRPVTLAVAVLAALLLLNLAFS